LHLEVTANEIKKRGVEITMSDPRAVFKESCRKRSPIITVQSPNEANLLRIQVERLDDKTVSLLKKTNLKGLKEKKKQEFHIKNTSLNSDEVKNLWNIDEDQNILINFSESDLLKEYKKDILEIVETIHLNGPLCGEKLTSIKILIRDLQLNDVDQESIFTELSTLFYNGMKEALNEAELILLEPIYRTVIQLPSDYLKKATSIFSKYSAKIDNINQDSQYQTVIEIFLPVRNSICRRYSLHNFR
jgi:translation elongation factor EF-G